MTSTPDTAAAVTVVIPCFNEEAALPPLLAGLAAMRAGGPARGWHFIFVDDGSTDGTFSTLLRAACNDSRVEVFRHPENLGLGAALRTGFAHCISPYVCTTGVSSVYPPERLPQLLAALAGGAAIATPAGLGGNGNQSSSGAAATALSRVLARSYNRFLGHDWQTCSCLFRAYRREVLERIRFIADGALAPAEILGRARLAGYQVEEVAMQLGTPAATPQPSRVPFTIAHARLLTRMALTTAVQQLWQLGREWRS
ncbi:MAG: glycosyltransferase family 2 protein [Deltaproteobacteria bacterium]|nr:glycosyltransferase family 2 protein [Deltaproteobacteria bacterium]